MTFEDISLLTALLVALYLFPALYLTVRRVGEIMDHAATREPRPRWVGVPCARFLVRISLSMALFVFYLAFAIPLIAYGLCRPYCTLAWGGVAAKKGIWHKRAYWICWGDDGGCRPATGYESGAGGEKSPCSVWKSRGKAGLKHHTAAVLAPGRVETEQGDAVCARYVGVGDLGMDSAALAGVGEGGGGGDAEG
ncbi:hypothetical protein F5B17DRAFT_432867 [Nemania serpens]|nr:hypothetical protein F5B17DRAFT_432867 [Nemania serpens]